MSTAKWLDKAFLSSIKGLIHRQYPVRKGERRLYLKTTYYVGDTIEVKKTISWRYGKKIPRQKGKFKPTPEKMADINEKNSIEDLRRLMANNFQNNDFHIVLKYPRGQSPPPLESEKHIEKFKRDMRKLYKKRTVKFMYIHVVEYKTKSTHHHMIVNSENIPIKEIKALWPWGSINFTPIYTAPDFAELACYFIKETKNSFRDRDAPSHRRWNASRNLKKPRKVTEVVSAKEWRETPVPVKGYYIDKDSVKNHVAEDGYPSQFYRMLKINRRS